MAEFCIECLNKTVFIKRPLKEKNVVLSYDICEDCGEWKPCVIRIKKNGISGLFKRLRGK